MANPIVIDMSHYQPDPDWAKLKANGTVGIIHKATEGTTYVDNTLFKRAKPALEAGLAWSTYHFLRPGNMTGQMDHYLKTVNPRQGERVCLDHEDAKVGLADLEQCVLYLMEQRPDVEIAIYSGHLIKEQLGSNRSTVLADNTSLWIAQYTTASAPSWPKATWPQWSLWQYTDKAQIAGISAPVDGNRWNGSVDNLVKWFGPTEATDEGGDEGEDLPVVEDRSARFSVETDEGVTVTVVVNGKEWKEVA